MKLPADIIRQLLIDLGVAIDSTTANWSVFSTREPESPDKCITVYDTAGVIDGRTHVDGAVQEHLGFQVRVRSRTYPDGRTKILAIETALEAVYKAAVTVTDEYGTDTTDYTVHSCNRQSSVLYLGPDDENNSGRHLFTLNYTLTLD